MKLYSIFLISVLTFFSCKKKEQHHQMSETFKDYTIYPVGSYWVYADSISGVITDSVVLTRQEFSKKRIDAAEYPGTGKAFEDYIEQVFTNYSTEGDSSIELTATTFFNNSMGTFSYAYEFESFSGSKQTIVAAFDNSQSNATFHEKYLIGDTNFTKVFQIENLHANSVREESFMAKQIGLVKFKVNERVFELRSSSLLN